MNRKHHWAGLIAGAVAISMAAAPAAFAENAKDCPNDGVVRFGVEPYDTSAKLVPIYDHIAKVLADKLGCEVKVFQLLTAMNLFQCREVSLLLIMIFVIVFAAERLSAICRQRLI